MRLLGQALATFPRPWGFLVLSPVWAELWAGRQHVLAGLWWCHWSKASYGCVLIRTEPLQLLCSSQMLINSCELWLNAASGKKEGCLGEFCSHGISRSSRFSLGQGSVSFIGLGWSKHGWRFSGVLSLLGCKDPRARKALVSSSAQLHLPYTR